MIGTNRPSEIWGIWVRANKTFYWLETGPARLTHAGDKLRSILIAKNILRYMTDHRPVRNEEPYTDMTLEQAEEKGYEIKRVFLTEHIKVCIEADEAKREAKRNSPWE
jgi:hypothetical protein